MDFNRVMQWLLEEDNPPVRYLTLKNLSNLPVEAEEAKKHLMDYDVTRGILSHLEEFIHHPANKAYNKYKGRYWQVIFLGNFYANGQSPPVSALVNTMLDNRKWIWQRGGHCLTANVLAALMRLGYGDHPQVKEETETLARRIVTNGGIDCEAAQYGLLHACYMAIPKLLLCFGEIPPVDRLQIINKAIDILVRIMLDNEVYIYVPGNRREWLKVLESLPRREELPEGQTVKALTFAKKVEFLVTRGPGKRDKKKGWYRFGFPLHYNSDILEAMVALARLGVPMQPQLEKALRAIKDKMTPDGMWILENDLLNGKMWADVEEKGKPSKWLTYFALYVLKHFEARV